MAEKASGTAASKKMEAAGMNKMDCVKKALETLGYEARPVELRDHIKKQFNVDMTTDHISANKSTILKKREKSMSSPKSSAMPAVTKSTTKPASKKKMKRKPTPTIKNLTAASTPKASMSTPAAATGHRSTELNLEKEAQTLKGLVDRLGMDNLQTLIQFVANGKS